MNNGAVSKSAKKRIVILGSGFGGVYAALHLEKLLARAPEMQTCLISRDNFFLFTPMLHEIAASDLEITNIAPPKQIGLRFASRNIWQRLAGRHPGDQLWPMD